MKALKKLPPPLPLRANRSGTRRTKPCKPPPLPIGVAKPALEMVSNSDSIQVDVELDVCASIPPGVDLTEGWFPKAAPEVKAPIEPAPPSRAVACTIDHDLALMQRDASRRRLRRIALAVALPMAIGGLIYGLSGLSGEEDSAAQRASQTSDVVATQIGGSPWADAEALPSSAR